MEGPGPVVDGSRRAMAALLEALDASSEPVLTRAWCDRLGVTHEELLGVVHSMIANELVTSTAVSSSTVECTKKGAEVLRDGSPEWRVWMLLPVDGAAVARETVEAQLGAEVFKAGHGICAKNRWIVATKTTLARAGDGPASDRVREQLAQLEALSEEALGELRKRQLVATVTYKGLALSRGPHFCRTGPRELARDLTHDMLVDDSWQTQAFKSMNREALGLAQTCGALHPLLKARTEYRQVFLEMGFQEMPTARYVESSFWNFDSLFQPQQHPVRDAHDTFFVGAPAAGPALPGDGYWERVRDVHERGGDGSIGWRYPWSEEESRKNLLRTHTTAVSSRMLRQLAVDCAAAGGVFTPRKYFSIDRVFRNEALDATHLAEFFQIEGLVADVGLTLGDLMGVIEAFFLKLGLPRLRFKPAYNPYTEPSMEVFSWHDGLGKFVEVGNSGMFRPEMLRPMGLPADVRVVAWGLGLERPTMIRIGCDDVRHLCGYQQPISTIVSQNPVVRLGKEHNAAPTAKGDE